MVNELQVSSKKMQQRIELQR